jgi:hypothetical protein
MLSNAIEPPVMAEGGSCSVMAKGGSCSVMTEVQSIDIGHGVNLRSMVVIVILTATAIVVADMALAPLRAADGIDVGIALVFLFADL